MKIKIKNAIDLDGQSELVEQEYEAEIIEKNEWQYLHYLDEEGIKNVIKFNDASFSITRFSQEKTKLDFKLGESVGTIMTPMGIQYLTTKTSLYEKKDNTVKIEYSLEQNNLKLADYRLEITYQL